MVLEKWSLKMARLFIRANGATANAMALGARLMFHRASSKVETLLRVNDKVEAHFITML